MFNDKRILSMNFSFIFWIFYAYDNCYDNFKVFPFSATSIRHCTTYLPFLFSLLINVDITSYTDFFFFIVLFHTAFSFLYSISILFTIFERYFFHYPFYLRITFDFCPPFLFIILVIIYFFIFYFLPISSFLIRSILILVK